MSKRKDRERAEKGLLYRGGRLVAKEEPEKKKPLADVPDAPEFLTERLARLERIMKKRR